MTEHPHRVHRRRPDRGALPRRRRRGAPLLVGPQRKGPARPRRLPAAQRADARRGPRGPLHRQGCAVQGRDTGAMGGARRARWVGGKALLFLAAGQGALQPDILCCALRTIFALCYPPSQKPPPPFALCRPSSSALILDTQRLAARATPSSSPRTASRSPLASTRRASSAPARSAAARAATTVRSRGGGQKTGEERIAVGRSKVAGATSPCL